MSNEMIVSEKNPIAEIKHTQEMVAQLMRTPHYAKLGEVGVFTIVQKARSIGIDVLDALNGAMYFVNGKVELSANAMNYLIRQAGHSIIKDEKSGSSICILKGKRKDNGDTFIASFTIEEAKRAGIYKNQWEKYPQDMLFARALTRLARQLFPDVIKGCYVEGEISSAMAAAKHDHIEQVVVEEDTISRDDYNDLVVRCAALPEDYIAKLLKTLSKHCGKEVSSFIDMPKSMFQRVSSAIDNKIRELEIAQLNEAEEVSDEIESE